jgi:hypothetical protein
MPSNNQSNLEMEKAQGVVRGSFSQSGYEQPDVKARFYRYFQEEVTGMTFLLSMELIYY